MSLLDDIFDFFSGLFGGESKPIEKPGREIVRPKGRTKPKRKSGRTIPGGALETGDADLVSVEIELKEPLFELQGQQVSRDEMDYAFAMLQAGNTTRDVDDWVGSKSGAKMNGGAVYFPPNSPWVGAGSNQQFWVMEYLIWGNVFPICITEVDKSALDNQPIDSKYVLFIPGKMSTQYNFVTDYILLLEYGQKETIKLERGKVYAIWLGQWCRYLNGKFWHREVGTEGGSDTVWSAIKGFFGGNLKKSKYVNFNYGFDIAGDVFFFPPMAPKFAFQAGVSISYGEEKESEGVGIDLGNKLNSNIKKVF